MSTQKLSILQLLSIVLIAFMQQSALAKTESKPEIIKKQSILPGGCYQTPIKFAEQPLKQAVPLKTGRWRHELLSSQGTVDHSSQIEACEDARDWRDVMLASAGASEEGCQPTRLTQKGSGKTFNAGFKEVCHQGSKTITRTGWLIPKSAVDSGLTAYEISTTLKISGSKKVEVERTLHTWVGACQKVN